MKEKQNWTDKLFNVITMAGTAILMNLMFLIACIPVVTIGPAWCGLMSSVRYNIRGEGWFAGFKKGYCTRFWRSLIIWCLCLPVCLFFLHDLNIAVKTVQGVVPVAQSVAVQPGDETVAGNGPEASEATLVTDATEVTAATNTATDGSKPVSDENFVLQTGATVPNIINCVISGLFFAMAAMVTVSLLTLNVYIPTTVSNWIKNGVNFFRRPLELLVAAALFWAPLLMFVFFPELFFFAIMVFIAAYFALGAVCGTMILKDPLIDFLIDARADGTLLAEEGSAVNAGEEG